MKKYSLEGRLAVVSEEEIMKILFHRGRMLLLDQVTIAAGKAVGELTVAPFICEGHAPMPNMPLMRGVDIVEMAFQLLGVIIAKIPEMADVTKGKVYIARRVTTADFSKFVRPGDELSLETTEDICVFERPKFLKVTSGKMTAKVGDEIRAIIGPVDIMAFAEPDSTRQEPAASQRMAEHFHEIARDAREDCN